jgi:hypothetical protein
VSTQLPHLKTPQQTCACSAVFWALTLGQTRLLVGGPADPTSGYRSRRAHRSAPRCATVALLPSTRRVSSTLTAPASRWRLLAMRMRSSACRLSAGLSSTPRCISVMWALLRAGHHPSADRLRSQTQMCPLTGYVLPSLTNLLLQPAVCNTPFTCWARMRCAAVGNRRPPPAAVRGTVIDLLQVAQGIDLVAAGGEAGKAKRCSPPRSPVYMHFRHMKPKTSSFEKRARLPTMQRIPFNTP